MVKPEYIQYIELKDGVFSIMKFHKFNNGIVKYLDEKFTRVFESGVVHKNGRAKWDEVIYQTKQDFFIHLKMMDDEYEEYLLDIYYSADKRNELLFLTSKLLKPFIDGTNNDSTIETENQ
jgi:hypothetical protein